MDRSSELRLPTVAVPVRVAVVGHPVIPAEIFVADLPGRARVQLFDDLAAQLDGDATFVPVRASGQVRLLAKHAIIWIGIHRRDPDAQAPEESPEVFTLYDRQHKVEIQLANGERLTGTLLDSFPADRPRVMDHLNRARHVVRLWTPDEHVLVTKAQIISVTERDA